MDLKQNYRNRGEPKEPIFSIKIIVKEILSLHFNYVIPSENKTFRLRIAQYLTGFMMKLTISISDRVIGMVTVFGKK